MSLKAKKRTIFYPINPDFNRLKKIQQWNDNHINELIELNDYIGGVFSRSKINDEKGVFKQYIIVKYFEYREILLKNLRSKEKLIPWIMKRHSEEFKKGIIEGYLLDNEGIKNLEFKKWKWKFNKELQENQEFLPVDAKTARKMIEKKDKEMKMIVVTLGDYLRFELGLDEVYYDTFKKITNLHWDALKTPVKERTIAVFGTLTLFYLQFKNNEHLRNIRKTKICKTLYAKETTISAIIENWYFKRKGIKITCVKGKKLIGELIDQDLGGG